jgi:hypothetical protein
MRREEGSIRARLKKEKTKKKKEAEGEKRKFRYCLNGLGSDLNGSDFELGLNQYPIRVNLNPGWAEFNGPN